MKKVTLGILAGLMTLGLFAGNPAHALIVGPGADWWDQDYSWCPDPTDDHVGNGNFSVLGIGYTIDNGYLIVKVDTLSFDLPDEGGSDSYNTYTQFQAGDLYINVGGMFQDGDGKVFGIGSTNHSGDITANSNDGPWTANVTSGSLWEDATFATGTLENYQTLTNETPDDGDGDDNVNSYPTLIQAGTLVAGADAGFYYDAASKDYYYYVGLSELGFTTGALTTSVQLTWAMECGNDLVEYKVVPEPATMTLLGAGLAAMVGRRRKTRA